MRSSIRPIAPGAASLGLILVLAACASPVADSPSPTPGASPSSEPTASPEPTATPSQVEVIEHDLPMTGRATADVDVRTLPSMDAPLLSGERLSDLSTVPDIRLTAGDLVLVTLGPVLADDQSWYEVRVVDGGEVYWEGGWVPGESLVREGDMPEGQAPMVHTYGLGSGTTITAEVAVGTPVTVRFAATPMPDSGACEIEVTLLRSDDLGVNVATESLTGPAVIQLTPEELSSLFQEEAGTVTLEVETDCSFAASLTIP